MPRAALRETDVRAVLGLVGDAHHADTLDEFRRMLIEALPEVVPTDYVSYNEVSQSRGPTVTLVQPELPAWSYQAWAQYGMQNPLIVRHLRTYDGRAYRFSDVISRSRLEALEIYTQLYRPLGIEHQLAFCLPSPARYILGMALSRGGDDFTERDRRVVNLARPHLIQAYRNVELRERAEGIVEAVRRGLDDADQAMVLVGDDHEIVFASEPARRLLHGATGAAVADGGPLPPVVAQWLRGDPQTPLVLEGRRPVGVRVLPGRRGEPAVLILEPGLRSVGASVLRGMGLTPREAEVLHLIMRGQANEDIAAELAISPRTVHKHVEHVFDKLGVGSRLEAVATVWAAVGVDDRD